MFTADRWISAFVNVLGEDKTAIEEGSQALKAMILAIRKIPGTPSGRVSALKLEAMIRLSMKETGFSGKGTEYACRLLVLLVRKRMYTSRNLTALLEEIERVIDERHGVLSVKIDSPFILDEKNQADIIEALKRNLGFKEIKLVYNYDPELIGGYRLRIGDISVDASLRFLLHQMTAHLEGIGGFIW